MAPDSGPEMTPWPPVVVRALLTPPAVLAVGGVLLLIIKTGGGTKLGVILLILAAVDFALVWPIIRKHRRSSETGSSIPPVDPEDGAETDFGDLPPGRKFKLMIREVGPVWVAFGLLTMPLGAVCLGIGADAGTHWLEIVGVGLLVVALLEHWVGWPARRARLAARRRPPK